MANNILEMALEQLDFPPSTISAWFDDVTVVSFGDNRLVLHSPVPFKKEFIESKFIAPLQEVLHNLTGDPITIVVAVSYTHLAAVQRRTAQICADDFMCFRGRVGQITHRAVVRRVVGLKRKRDDLILTGLLRQIGIID